MSTQQSEPDEDRASRYVWREGDFTFGDETIDAEDEPAAPDDDDTDEPDESDDD